MEDMSVTSPRMYRGQDAAERRGARRAAFFEAALELMARDGVSRTTVRAVIAAAGLAPRYFYDLYENLDELHVAVLTQLLADAERASTRALLEAPREVRAQTKAVLAACVDYLLDDPRRGRVLLLESLGSPAMGARRMDESERFAGFLAAQASAWSGADANDPAVIASAHYALNGFVGVMSAVLAGRLEMSRADLVSQLANSFLRSGPARDVSHQGTLERDTEAAETRT